MVTNSEMVSQAVHSTGTASNSSTGNGILSGNNGISIGKKVRKSETLGTYVGTIIDDVTVPLEPGSSDSIWGSPSQNGNNDGNNNSAGNGNDNNASGNGSNDGNNNGNSMLRSTILDGTIY